MRVTQNFIYEAARFHMGNNATTLLKIQEQVATQKRINRISDDSLEGTRLLDVKTGKSRTAQFLRNIERADSLAGIYDQVLGQANDLISRAKELLLGEASEVTSTAVTREAARVEIASITSQLVRLANTEFGGSSIFSGFAIDQQAFLESIVTSSAGGGNSGGATITRALVDNPAQIEYASTFQVQFTAPGTFDVINISSGSTVLSGQTYTSGGSIFFNGLEVVITDSPGAPAAGDTFDFSATAPGVYQGDAGRQQVELQNGTFIQQNLLGDRVFSGVGISGGVDVFDILADINTALRTDDRAQIEANLDRLDSGRQQIAAERASVGSRQNLLRAVKDLQTEIQFSLETLRSSIEDADLPEIITRLSQAEVAFENTLIAAGRVLQISLLNFLR